MNFEMICWLNENDVHFYFHEKHDLCDFTLLKQVDYFFQDV